MLRSASTAVFICFATLAAAQTGSLTESSLRDLVSGAVVELDTPLGTRIPIHYSEDGRLSGHAKDLASYLGAPADSGRWWVTGDQVCHKWDKWFKGEPQCLRIDKRGSKVNWRSQDGTSGTATVVSRSETVSPVATSPAPPVRTEAAPQPARPAPSTTTIVAAAPRQQPLSPPMRLTPPAPHDVPAPTAVPQAQPAPTAKRPSVIASAAAPGLVSRSAAAAKAKAPPGSAPEAAAIPAIKKSSAIVGSPAAPGGPLFKVARVESDDVLNIRQGPSSETAAVGAIPPDGRGIEMTGDCQSGWCPVRHREVTGWVNRQYLDGETDFSASSPTPFTQGYVSDGRRDPSFAERTCLTPPARSLIDRIEANFGAMRLVSTCRAGARIAGSGRTSKHATGNAIDFEAGPRKQQVVEWLIANHHAGGIMTYSDMDHVHVDIGPHFVSLGAPSGGGGGRHSRRPGRWASSG